MWTSSRGKISVQRKWWKWWNEFRACTCYNQLQKYLRHCTVFWHKWPVHDPVLVIPPPPLIKVASNARPYSKLGGPTLNGREVSFIFYRPVTRSDLKQERAFFRGSVSTFLQLVVATACPNGKLLNWLSFHPGGNCLLNFLSSFHWPNPPPPPPTPSKHFTWSRAALSSLSQVLPGYTRKNLAQYLDFTASIFFFIS